MPLPGGPSDKAGNSYERRWTVFAVLDLLEGKGQSLRIEVPGEDGVGAEFRVLSDGVPVWHQAKRQRDAGPWTIANMANEGVLGPWWAQIQGGGRCVFVSSTGAQELHELAERASGANSWSEFESEFLTGEQPKRFRRLRTAWGDPPEEAVYQALGSIEVRLLGEQDLAGYIEARLASLVAGPPQTAAAVLAQLVDDSRHQELTPSDVWKRLAASGIEPRNLSLDAILIRRIGDTADLFVRRIRRTHIGGRELHRTEADDAFDHLVEGHNVLISGAAGSGKSVITSQVAQRARRAGWPVLVLSVDRMPDAETAYALGASLGLPDSPPTVLAGMAAGGDALLVLDQLDAVSVASGRHPERLAIVEEMLGQADSHPRLRVLLACRQFDLDNDRTLRTVATASGTRTVSARGLEAAEIVEALAAAGLPSDIPEDLADLLSVPLHLAIYVELGPAGASGAAVASSTELYNQYWDAKRRACRLARGGEDQWLEVIDRLVDRMSLEQKLATPTSALDDLDEQVTVMGSEGVLVSDGDQVAFFHEAFFDYCFARRFVAAGENLRELLETKEQDLFQRAQVRQILTYERGTLFDAYLADLTWLLSAPAVRHHIKALVVALAQTVAHPQRDEWLALRAIAIDKDHPLHGRLWQALRSNPAWFPLLQDEGEWAAWLDLSDPTITDRSLWVLAGMASAHPEKVSALLLGVKRDELRPTRLRGFLRLTDVHSSRAIFDLFLEGIQEGAYEEDPARDFWHAMRDLAEKEPEWAVEALDVLLGDALERGADNPFEGTGPLTADRNSLADEAVLSIADGAPRAFVEQLLPHMLEIARRNAHQEWSGGDVLLDTVWGMHFFGAHTQLKDAFYAAMENALRALAQREPDFAETVFERLRSDPHETAWFLLARGYEANPERFADDAADWLAETPGALHLGYSDASHWISRELIAAVTRHCSQTQLDRLIAALIHYAPPFERTHQGLRQRGYGELCLLNAVHADRRSPATETRLAELRRKFLVED
ncbi:MAG: hypothetical protein ACREA0_01480, partial [bacterium]